MQHNLRNRSGLGLLLGLCGFAISAGLHLSSARAEDSDRPIIAHSAPAAVQASLQAEHAQLEDEQPGRRAKSAAVSRRKSPGKAADKSAGQYFVEFRSRYALSYGHTFLVHGRLNGKGQVDKLTPDYVAGLHPRGEGPQLWTVGHVLPVPSETGPSDGDLEEQYVSARFRVLLSEAQYKAIAAHIRQKQMNSPAWHAVFYNCNTWVGEVARFMGLKAPSNNLLYPADYIANLREINGGQHNVPLGTAAASAAGGGVYAAAP